MKKRIMLVLLCIAMLVNILMPVHAGVNGDSMWEHNYFLYDEHSGYVTRYKTVASCELEPYEHAHYTLATVQTLYYECADCGEKKTVVREFYYEPWICCLHDAG